MIRLAARLPLLKLGDEFDVRLATLQRATADTIRVEGECRSLKEPSFRRRRKSLVHCEAFTVSSFPRPDIKLTSCRSFTTFAVAPSARMNFSFDSW